MFDNHGYKNIVTYLTGVTRQSGKTLQIAETKTVSAIFVIPLSGRIVNIVRYGGVQFVNS
jgi:hypothetical protein